MSIELIEFPRGIYYKANLASAAQVVGVADVGLLVRHVLLSGGTAVRVVSFESTDNGVTYFTVTVPAATNVQFGSFRVRDTEGSAEGGLDVFTDSGTADVGITIFYHATHYTA